MGRRVFALLHREIRGLSEAAYVLAFFTFCSQLLALLRDRIFAHTFGAGETLDLFYAAFRVPDTIYAMLVSTVSLFVLIPFLERAAQEGAGGIKNFLSDMFSFFSGTLVVVAGCAWLFTPQLVHVLYGGFGLAEQGELVPFIRVLLLQPFLLGVSNLFATYVQLKGRFVLYAIAPILYNAGAIVGAVFLYPAVGPIGLAWGVVVGALLHLGVQTPFLIAEGMLPRFQMPDWKRVWGAVRLSIPRTITLSVQQLVLLVFFAAASFFSVGSISSFMFAMNLQAVPLSIIGVSYSVAAFPKLAHLFGRGERKEYVTLVVHAARQIIFWALPVTVLFVVLRTQIVRVILGSGAFDRNATMLTSAVLALLVVSLATQALVVLLVRAWYAAGVTLVPLILNVGSSIATVGFAFCLLTLFRSGWFDLHSFERLMQVREVAGGEILLLAIAYSLGSVLGVVLMLTYFARSNKGFIGGLVRTAWMSLVASLSAGTVTYIVLGIIAGIIPDTTSGVFLQGALAGLVGISTWVLILSLLGNGELAEKREALRRRLFQIRVSGVQGSIEER